jgi:electron transport complex protein RnfG
LAKYLKRNKEEKNMEKLKSSITNMALVLTGVAVITGGILAYVNNLTSGPIAQQKEKALADGIKAVMGGGELSVAKTDTVRQNDEKGKEMTYIIYQTQDSQKKDLGAAVESTTQGFGGDLKILVGFDPEGNILGYTLLEHAETPGLGAKADQWFQKGAKGDIIGKNPKEQLVVSKDGGQVDAITASTITSRAFLLAVNNAYKAYKATPVDGLSGATEQKK